MSTLTEARPEGASRVRRRAVAALGVGLLLTVATLVALVVDQVSAHGIADHVQALYGPFNLSPDPNVLFTILYVTGVCGVALWLATIWGAVRQKRGLAILATVVFLAATSIGFLGLVVAEHGTRILPTLWGVLGLLPCLAGFVAVVLLWKPRKGGS